MERIYHFVKRNAVKKGIFQNINFQYSMRGDNRINSDDETISQKGLFYGAKSGIQHNIPISTNFKIAKHFNFSLGGNYSEVWTNQTIRKFDYDLLSESIPAQDTINGFDRFSKYNYSASVGTTLYGVFNFNKQNRLQSIRHVLNANVSYSNQPGFEKYYDEYIIDAFGNTRTYSRFDGGLYGTPGNRKSSSVGITLRNTVEAKVKDDEKNDDEDFKKIKILNNLNFTTNYNIVADSLNWSPVRMSTVVPLFDNKLSLNIGATFDPYALNEEKNRKINKFSINNNGPLFRMTSANMNWGYNFSSKNNKNKERNQQSNIPGMNIKKGLDEDRNSLIKPPELEDRKEEKSTKSDLYITEIPWTLNLRHSLTYLNNFQQREISNNSIMASANVGLTPKWNINISSGYDFKNKGITYTNLGINRDLDSWEMNISWTPFGYRESWYFFIGVKSGLLRDLKYDKRREPDKRL